MDTRQFHICGMNNLGLELEEYNYTHVLSLIRSGKSTDLCKEVVSEYDVNHHVENFDDVDSLDKKWYDKQENNDQYVNITFPNKENIESVVEFVDKMEDDSKMLIHCQAGVSRSTAMTFGIMVYKGFDITDAFKHVHIIQPMHHMNSLVLKLWDDKLGLNSNEDGSLVGLNRLYEENRYNR